MRCGKENRAGTNDTKGCVGNYGCVYKIRDIIEIIWNLIPEKEVDFWYKNQLPFCTFLKKIPVHIYKIKKIGYIIYCGNKNCFHCFL